MFDLSRRRVLITLAATLAGLSIRRAAARPVRIEPFLSKRPPAAPPPALSTEYHVPPFDVWPDGRRKHPFGCTERLMDVESRIRADMENKRQSRKD